MSDATWDYLIVTASHEQQARTYRRQLELRRRAGRLEGIRRLLVVPDVDGRRVGSGGSTLHCLLEVLNEELPAGQRDDPDRRLEALKRLRILLVHAGGDSRRVPAYGACGKIFVPMPVPSDSELGTTLFDLQLPRYLALPPMPSGAGQLVVTSGDILLEYDPAQIRFHAPGATGIGVFSAPEPSRHHGVFCPGPDGQLETYLQKPSPQLQHRSGAVDRLGRVSLDIGLMNFDALAAERMLSLIEPACDENGRLAAHGQIAGRILDGGLDLYRGICCAYGRRTRAEDHLSNARGSGTACTEAELARIYRTLNGTAFHVHTLSDCRFLHFGTTRQLLTSGECLRASRDAGPEDERLLRIDTATTGEGTILGEGGWVEGCRIEAPLTLAGQNVVVGADILRPLEIPSGRVLDVQPGRDEDGREVRFVRCYGVGDDFKTTLEDGGTLADLPMQTWMECLGATVEDLWGDRPAGQRSGWFAEAFCCEPADAPPGRWLWMLRPEQATDEQRRQWRQARRYSIARMAALCDAELFEDRRMQIRRAFGPRG